MSGRIPRQFIDDLLVRVDIVDLIDSHVPLKKTGANFVARCPFHTEKTPSFSVNRTRQIYHCFGCGVSGNAIGFLMAFNHLDFVEAVEDLAAFVGVEVPRENAGAHAAEAGKADYSRLYAVLDGVADFYVEQLRGVNGKPAVDYLKARGVSGEVARDFAIGFAPNDWEALPRRFDQKNLIDAGMLVVREDGRAYDRFRGRLMFPIRDKRGRVLGFGGRVLDDALPKYLNSPETVLFSKGKELYGLYELLNASARPERILVVEGYMDVIALAQFGVRNAVAALGTATSKAQIDLLFRFASELVFCFDGDNAGRQAAWKAVDAALPALREGRQVKIMLLPQAQDPDSLIRSEGMAGFAARIADAKVLSDYFFEYLGQNINLATTEGRAQLVAAAKPLLEKIPAGIFRDMMQLRLQEMSGLLSPEPRKAAAVRKKLVSQPKTFAGKLSSARTAAALLVQHPQLAQAVDHLDFDEKIMVAAGLELLVDLFKVIALEKPENTAILLECYRGSIHAKSVNALARLPLIVPEGREQQEFDGALKCLLEQARETRLTELLGKESREGLSVAEKDELRRLLLAR